MIAYSIWDVYTSTNKKTNAQTIICKFFEKNSTLEIDGSVRYGLYEKTDTIKANFRCAHTASSWEMLTYNIVAMAQTISNSINISGNIHEGIELILSNIRGGKGGISSIFMVCENPLVVAARLD